MITPPVVTENLSKSYPIGRGQVHALRGVSLRLEAGEFVALMGASGSGKSTLLHLLGCLDTPTSGRYWLAGQDAAALSGNARALLRNQTIGFIFQNFNLLPRLSALENVALPLLYRRDSQDARKIAAACLRRVGLAQRSAHQPNELSGGERQRVAIARALASSPTLLLADEPTGNLDSATSSEIMHLLVDLNQEGRTILMVTHDASIAAYAQRTLMMQDGRII